MSNFGRSVNVICEECRDKLGSGFSEEDTISDWGYCGECDFCDGERRYIGSVDPDFIIDQMGPDFIIDLVVRHYLTGKCLSDGQ